jgi:hypothetical protein
METGERVAHFAEIDANAFERYDQQALYLRPAARLRGGARYAVGIRRSTRQPDGDHLLRGRDGLPLPTPDGFTAILTYARTEHARFERVRKRYDDIFAAFEAAGIPRDELVVAWDFTTGSDAQINADMLGARDAALAAMGERAANMHYTVTTDEPVDDGAQIKRRIKGTFQAPMLLTDVLRGSMRRDASGKPVTDGTADFPFVAMVPACASAKHKAGILVFGHGFFGDIGEAQGSYMRRVAEELCLVVVGTEWVGMRTDDVASALDALADLNLGMAFGERIIQGMIDTMTLAQLARGAMASDLLVEGGESIVDPEKIYFFGISQGAILGSTFFAFDPTISRGAFNVGGANWSLLFERSNHWNQFSLPIKGNYPGALNLVIIQALLQFGMDLTDPVNVAQRTLADPYPGTPEKHFLLQIAAGDCQVSNLAGLLQTRTLGMPMLTPSVAEPYGIDGADGPLPSALVVYDEHPTPPPEVSNLVNSVDNGTHGSMRTRNAVVRQLGHFFETGEVVDTCGDGTVPCDCSTGACD